MPPGPPSDLAVAEAALTEADLAQIKDAILVAYPEKQALYGLLLDKWGVRASDVIYTEQAGALAIAALIEWAKGQGRTLELLSLAWTEKHRQHLPLQELAERFFPAPEVEVHKYGLTVGTSEAPSPEAAFAVTAPLWASIPRVPASRFLKAELVAGLAPAICVVEIGGIPRATGFLIGRRTVLTVHSGMADAISNGTSGADIRLCFDRRADAPQTVVSAAPGLAWQGPFSPFSQADVGGEGTPGPDELDFAVVILEQAVDPPRAALVLPDRVPIVAPGDAMFIAQHPMGGPLAITTGTLIGYTVEGQRLHYRAETAPGSGGAPVVSWEGNLIAVHHAASMVGQDRVAQGVPIWPIRQAIVAAGYRLEDL